MELAVAQAEMRRSFVNGGPGAVVSGFVWAAAAITLQSTSFEKAFVVLFFGGMFIFPIGAIIVRGLMRRPGPSPDNRLGTIALESTIAMIGGFFPAFLLLRLEPTLAFPVAAIAVGTHYFAFSSVYGKKDFWALGAVITAMGVLDATAPGKLFVGLIWSVALVEILFGLYLTLANLRGGLASEAANPGS